MNAVTRTNNTTTIQFGAKQFTNYQLEGRNTLFISDWFTVASFTGSFHSHLQIFTDSSATNSARFYRLREIPQ